MSTCQWLKSRTSHHHHHRCRRRCHHFYRCDIFFRSFHFHDLRVDEALRSFLESFRLPGESPVIEHIIEFFSELFYVSGQVNYIIFVKDPGWTIRHCARLFLFWFVREQCNHCFFDRTRGRECSGLSVESRSFCLHQ